METMNRLKDLDFDYVLLYVVEQKLKRLCLFQFIFRAIFRIIKNA